MTYTFATLAISPSAYQEIRSKLMEANYAHTMRHIEGKGEVIDMHGVGLVSERASAQQSIPVVVNGRVHDCVPGGSISYELAVGLARFGKPRAESGHIFTVTYWTRNRLYSAEGILRPNEKISVIPNLVITVTDCCRA